MSRTFSGDTSNLVGNPTLGMRIRGLSHMRGRRGKFLRSTHAHKRAITRARGPHVAITVGTNATTVSAIFSPPMPRAVYTFHWGVNNTVVTCGGLIIKRFGLATHRMCVLDTIEKHAQIYYMRYRRDQSKMIKFRI